MKHPAHLLGIITKLRGNTRKIGNTFRRLFAHAGGYLFRRQTQSLKGFLCCGKLACICADFDVFLVKFGFQFGGFGAHIFQLDCQLAVKVAGFATVGTQGRHTVFQR